MKKKELEKMTRRELAEIIVNDQIKRGVIKKENKEKQIKARLTGMFKMGWLDLYETAKHFI